MTIIYRTHANRITIAEAKRLILENLPKELCGSVYARITPDGDIDWDGPVDVIEEAVVMAEPFIDRDFPVMLEQMKTEPMMRFRPAVKGYPESKTMDAEYTIAHDEFCRVADGYQLLVQIGEAAPPPHALKHEAATPAPVVADGDAPAKRSNRKPSWATVAMPYMKSLFTAGHYKSASMFYKALMHRAGESDSPFKLVNRELYCTEAGTTVSEGSLGNVWPQIRAH